MIRDSCTAVRVGVQLTCYGHNIQQLGLQRMHDAPRWWSRGQQSRDYD